jgi:hypothetical protein
VICHWCTHKFTHGVTWVRRFVLFHFCADCVTHHRPEVKNFVLKVTA